MIWGKGWRKERRIHLTLTLLKISLENNVAVKGLLPLSYEPKGLNDIYVIVTT